MKTSLLYFVSILMVACTSNTNEIDSKSTYQTWKLVKMTGSFIGSETTGIDMEWQETIELKSNGVFEKTRVRNGDLIIATGSYSYLDLEDGIYLELTYPSESTLVGNCYGNLKETYQKISNTKLQGTWLACDGPGLEYNLIINPTGIDRYYAAY